MKGDVIGFKHYFWAVLRIAFGLIFLWAFFDKFIGLGFATCLNSETNTLEVLCENAWINGGSPTYGFLKFGTHGPFSEFYQSIASSVLVEWLFMFGLLFIGLTLTFGFMIRLGSFSGALMMVLMYSALIVPEHHPFIDEHLIYAWVMLGFALVHTCRHFGLGKWWTSLKFVKNRWILH